MSSKDKVTGDKATVDLEKGIIENKNIKTREAQNMSTNIKQNRDVMEQGERKWWLIHGVKFAFQPDGEDSEMDIAASIEEVTPNNEDIVEEKYDMLGQGEPLTFVLGTKRFVEFTGFYEESDPFLNYVYGEALNHGKRAGTFTISYPDGSQLTGPAIIHDITGPEGAAADGFANIGFTISFSGNTTVKDK